jgi:hypothetical protein
MTVKELKEKLDKFEDDSEVLYWNDDADRGEGIFNALRAYRDKMEDRIWCIDDYTEEELAQDEYFVEVLKRKQLSEIVLIS